MIGHAGEASAPDLDPARRGRSKPARMWSRVDLPEPEGPMIELNVLGPNSTVTPRRASTAAAPSP